MANHKSAKKRHTQSVARRTANRKVKKAFKSQLKAARAEIAAGGAKPGRWRGEGPRFPRSPTRSARAYCTTVRWRGAFRA